MDSALDWHQAKALVDWYVEMGVIDAVGDTALDRYVLSEEAAKAAAPANAPAAPRPAQRPAADTPYVEPLPEPKTDWVGMARGLAARAGDLGALAQAMQGFDGLDLKRGARSFVFSDGNPAARVMIVGEAPGADEDRIGRPFVGRAGQLLDRMLAAIGLDRASEDAARAAYITNVLPWRPPGNRTPSPEEMAIMAPFVERHVELANPDVLILMGNTPCMALLGRQGILRLRGSWVEVNGRPAMPMTHPAYLLRTPEAKREAWADLLAIQARLRAGA